MRQLKMQQELLSIKWDKRVKRYLGKAFILKH